MFDLNGKKGPNIAGKDIWYISANYPSDSSVITIEPDKITKEISAKKYDEALQYCASKEARLATFDEAVAYMGFIKFGWLQSSAASDHAYHMLSEYGPMYIDIIKKSNKMKFRCIKRKS